MRIFKLVCGASDKQLLFARESSISLGTGFHIIRILLIPKFNSRDLDECLQRWKKLESSTFMTKYIQAKQHASTLADISKKLKHAVNHLMVGDFAVNYVILPSLTAKYR
jgi:hypothetical protein